MAILKVARIGHPVLRRVSKPVPDQWWKSDSAGQFIRDLIETMHEYDGVGLAAPQVHASIRVAVVEIKPNPRYPNAPTVPLTILINPKPISVSNRMLTDWEGCLSIPEFRGAVDRSEQIEIEASDQNGKIRRISADGFFARAIQHEIDHLDGKLYLDRMPDMTLLSRLDEYRRFHASQAEQDRP